MLCNHRAELVSVNPNLKEIGFIIHHKYDEEELQTAEVKKEFARIKHTVVEYAFDEFIEKGQLLEDWTCRISGIYDPTI